MSEKFEAKVKSLELAVSFCQTEGLLEITRMQQGKASKGLASPEDIINRAKKFETYLNEEA